MTFEDLGLCPQILAALKEEGYKHPSPIQEQAIPPALAGRDVLGCAQTGTGKTCAFAAPILQRLSKDPSRSHPGSLPFRLARALNTMAVTCPCAAPSSSAAWDRPPRWKSWERVWTFW